jgi:hypothetical protein
MSDRHANDQSMFIVPGQTLRGSREDMLADIDQAIMGLLALRHLISGEPACSESARMVGRTRHSFWGVGDALRSLRVVS